MRETHWLQEKGFLQLLPKREVYAPDPKLRLTAYASAISNEQLVKAAVPDFDNSRIPEVPDTVFYGFSMAPAGKVSRFDTTVKDPYRLQDSEPWTFLAWLRLARAIKFLEKAQSKGLIPLCLDWPNQNISFALGAKAFPEHVSGSQFAERAISLTVIDPETLETELASLSWQEIMKLRKEVLPKVSDVRTTILSRLAKFSRHRKITLEKYESEVVDFGKNWRALRNDSQKNGESLDLVP